MARVPEPQELVGRWIHVFEEDDAKGEVYRREDADIPLSRRPRDEIEFRDDGSATVFIAGDDDRPRGQAASWTGKAGAIVLRVASPAGRSREIRVTLRSRGRLIVQRGAGR
jgi:hypothetical protein